MGEQCKSSVANSKVDVNTELHFIFQFWNWQSHVKHSRGESDGCLSNTGITLFFFNFLIFYGVSSFCQQKYFETIKITSNWIMSKMIYSENYLFTLNGRESEQRNVSFMIENRAIVKFKFIKAVAFSLIYLVNTSYLFSLLSLKFSF